MEAFQCYRATYELEALHRTAEIADMEMSASRFLTTEPFGMWDSALNWGCRHEWYFLNCTRALPRSLADLPAECYICSTSFGSIIDTAARATIAKVVPF